MTELDLITDFLTIKRLAIIGVSRTAQDYSRSVMREFISKGYEIIPVNPLLKEADGVVCLPRIAEVKPQVTAALILTAPDSTEDVVHECAAAEIKKLWIRHLNNHNSLRDRIEAYCLEHKIDLIINRCPLMILSSDDFPHNIHAFLSKLTGHYPT